MELHGRTSAIQLRLVELGWTTADLVGGGHRWVPDCIGSIFPNSNMVVTPVHRRSRLRIRLRDGYWMRLVRGDEYEPEVGALLRSLSRVAESFIDCGANIGYWSVGAAECWDHVVAIEPIPELYQELVANHQLNGGRLQTVHAAVWSADDHVVNLTYNPRRHGASSVSTAGGIAVGTVSIDRIARSLPEPLIIKLDVEGAEVRALKGAKRTLARDVVLIYEDHGNDSSCTNSRYILDELGFHVFDPRLRRPCYGLSDIVRSKEHPSVGYNFVAYPPSSTLADHFLNGSPS